MKQPDRFERIVKKAMEAHDSCWLSGPEVVALLRKEHNAVVRVVKGLTRYDEYEEYYPERSCGIAAMKQGRYVNLESLLDQLAKRRM